MKGFLRISIKIEKLCLVSWFVSYCKEKSSSVYDNLLYNTETDCKMSTI